MKKTIATLLLGTLTLSAQAGLFKSEERLVRGLHFYDSEVRSKRTFTNQLTDIVKEITAQNELGQLEFKSPRNSKVTEYRVLQFEKDIDGSGNFRVRANKLGNQDSIYAKVDTKHNEIIERLLTDMGKSVDMIESYKGHSYDRGGVIYTLKNIETPKSIKLVCKNEVYSDGSGGNRCHTEVERINLDQKGATLMRQNINRSYEVEDVNWGDDAFEVTNEDLIKEVLKNNLR